MEEVNTTGKIEQVKLPKNIRQIGNIGPHNKVIYVEDYVMTFIKQLSCRDYTGCKVAILLGYSVRTEEGRNLFIKGAIEMKDTDFSNEITFSDQAWTSIYENIKKYFTDVEIVGWSLIGPEFFLESGEKIRKLHMDNFVGPDKTLLKMDSMEKEEAFYFFENNHLIKQTGYYIYYEKNEEMQSYMVENKEVVMEEKDYDDRTTRKIRTVIKEKKEQEPKDDKNVMRLLYASSTVLAVIVLIIAAAMLNNYGQLKSMETAINAISASLSKTDDSQRQVADTTEKTTSSEDESQVADANQKNDVSQSSDANQEDTALIDNSSEDTSEAAAANNSTEESQDVADGKTTKVETVSGNINKDNDSDTSKPEDSVSNTEDAKDNTDNKAGDTTAAADNKKEDTPNTDTVKADTNNTVEDNSKAASAELKYYVVQQGDSLASICLRLYKSSKYIDTIKELNGIIDENKILVGQKLIIP